MFAMSGRDSVFELVRAANIELLREALEHDPSLAAQRDGNGMSAVMHARYRGDAEILAALLALDPPLDIFDAAALGRSDRARELLLQDPAVANAWAPDGFAPLHLAAYFGHVEVVELLIAHAADVRAVARNPMQLTALHSAAAARHDAIVGLLLEHGADPDAIQAGGFTPLHAAAQNGDSVAVDLLLARGADRTLAADDGRDAAAMAAERGHEEIAARLRG